MKTAINTAIVVLDIRKMPLRHLSNDAMMNVQGTLYFMVQEWDSINKLLFFCHIMLSGSSAAGAKFHHHQKFSVSNNTDASHTG